MTTKEYIEKRYNDEYEEECREYNRELCKKYPWLIPTNRFSGKRITDCTGEEGEEGFWPGEKEKHPEYNWDHTEMDEMPDGWRIAFGDKMCEEINKELEKFDFVDEFRILQIKEKYGTLRFYCGGLPVGKLSEEYEEVRVKEGENYPRNNGWLYVYQGKDGDDRIFYKYKILEKCKIYNIIKKYEKISEGICIKCGKKATKISQGWICPYCDDCAKKVKYERFLPVWRVKARRLKWKIEDKWDIFWWKFKKLLDKNKEM